MKRIQNYMKWEVFPLTYEKLKEYDQEDKWEKYKEVGFRKLARDGDEKTVQICFIQYILMKRQEKFL